MFSSSSTLTTPRQCRKGYVPPSLYYSKYSEDRPKGKGQLSSSARSSAFDFYKTEAAKQNSRKKIFQPQNSSNPILQEEILHQGPASSRKIGSAAPSPLTIYSSQRKYNLPSEMGIGNRYEKHYSSQIFKEFNTTYLFNGKTKPLLSKKAEVQGLLKYEYALPFKEEKVTPKIGGIKVQS